MWQLKALKILALLCVRGLKILKILECFCMWNFKMLYYNFKMLCHRAAPNELKRL